MNSKEKNIINTGICKIKIESQQEKNEKIRGEDAKNRKNIVLFTPRGIGSRPVSSSYKERGFCSKRRRTNSWG